MQKIYAACACIQSTSEKRTQRKCLDRTLLPLRPLSPLSPFSPCSPGGPGIPTSPWVSHVSNMLVKKKKISLQDLILNELQKH